MNIRWPRCPSQAIRWLLAFSACVIVTLCYLTWILCGPLGFEGGARTFEVQPKTTLSHIAADLHTQGILKHPRYFMLYGRLTGASRHVQTGEYLIRPNDSMASVMQCLAHGRTYQRAWVLLPGWSVAQIKHALAQAPSLHATIQHDSAATLAQRLGVRGGLEGQLLPETYFYSKGDDDLSVLRRAHAQMHTALRDAWAQRAPQLPYKHPRQALIVASMIEKETACAAEMPRIAGVMLYRWQRGMKLQVDPTVLYAISHGWPEQFMQSTRSKLTHNDLSHPSPYNTYRHRGLPPTPIATPGPLALHAALHPEYTGDLYYVATDTGCHVFSKRLRAHRAATRQYR